MNETMREFGVAAAPVVELRGWTPGNRPEWEPVEIVGRANVGRDGEAWYRVRLATGGIVTVHPQSLRVSGGGK